MANTPKPSTELATTHPTLLTTEGVVTVTSIQVAQHFGKRHADVLRSIRDLECSEEFTERNFALSEFLDPTGRKLPCFHITRDGFAMLAFGFTGKEAAKWRESYINAFNAMETRLRGLTVLPLGHDPDAYERATSYQIVTSRQQAIEQLYAIRTSKDHAEKRQHYRVLLRINGALGVETDSMEVLGIERPQLKLEGGAA